VSSQKNKKGNGIGQQISQDGQEEQVHGKQGLSAEH